MITLASFGLLLLVATVGWKLDRKKKPILPEAAVN
jgi:hypothetical protein